MSTNNTVTVLARAYLGSPEGTICEPTSHQGVFRIQGTAKFVGSAFTREIEVEVAAPTPEAAVGVSAQDQAPTEFAALDMITLLAGGIHGDTTEENEAINYLRSHISGFTINVGDKYRYYTRSTNRWDLATFEMTGTDIGRVLAGYAVKVPSRKSAKRKLLKALNTVYGLMLSADEIQQSANN